MGLVLIVVPWSAFWDRNLFVLSLPLVKDMLTNNFVRGAVSGLGVVTVGAGFLDLAAVMVGRRGSALRDLPVASFDISARSQPEGDHGSTIARM